MDGNPSSIAALMDKLKAKLLPEDSSIFNIDFAKADVSEMQDKFDLVLCEGAIPGQTHPVQFASKLFTLVVGGGQIVLTCADVYSTLPELLRRLFRPHLIKHGFEAAVSNGIEIFSSHLECLPGASRSTSDWVADQILNPWTHSNWQFSILDALKLANEYKFDFLGSSPSFYLDWKWYKEVVDSANYRNKLAMQLWESQRIFTIDKRLDPSFFCFDLDHELDELLQDLVGFVALATTDDDFQYSNFHERKLDNLLLAIIEILQRSNLRNVLEPTIQALAEFKDAWPEICKGKLDVDCKSFKSWLGRGTQYISFQNSPSLHELFQF